MRLRKYEEVTVELNLEERHAWWGDRRQASPKMGWTTEWRVGIWGIYICRSTARRGCMKQADKGEVVKGLWWSRDLYPLGSSGRIFISHVAQSDLGFFDYTGSHVEKNVTKDSNSVAKALRSLENSQGKFKVRSPGILRIRLFLPQPPYTLLTLYTKATKGSIWVFVGY